MEPKVRFEIMLSMVCNTEVVNRRLLTLHNEGYWPNSTEPPEIYTIKSNLDMTGVIVQYLHQPRRQSLRGCKLLCFDYPSVREPEVVGFFVMDLAEQKPPPHLDLGWGRGVSAPYYLWNEYMRSLAGER